MRSVNEKIRKAIFAKLRSLRRKLNAGGVPCTYARSVLSHNDGDTSFRLTFSANNNGDSVLVPQLTICVGDAVESFDRANFELGLARVGQLFRVQNHG